MAETGCVTLALTKRRLLRGIGVASVFAAINMNGAVGSLAESNSMNAKTSSSEPLPLSPGVHPGAGVVSTAENAAGRAVELAEQASKEGTFGVGGLLVDRSGRVIAQARNAVIRDGHVADPTAHVERQLIDWYAQGRARGLPSPDELTIVSSLDPCAMCAGAILRSGMKVIAVAEDQKSGVHENLEPRRMPRELFGLAQDRMAFFGITGKRPAPTANMDPLFHSEISPQYEKRSTDAFIASLEAVQRLIGGASEGGPRLYEPAKATRAAVQKLAQQLGRGIRPVSKPTNVHEFAYNSGVVKLLAGDATALVDERGNMILAAGGAEDKSLARTSVLELIRAYAYLRRVSADQNICLPHQRHCSLVKWTVPSDPAKGLLELGATGSFLEQERKTKVLPAMGCIESANLVKARAFAASLPPLYAEIGITVEQIAPAKRP